MGYLLRSRKGKENDFIDTKVRYFFFLNMFYTVKFRLFNFIGNYLAL
jgi:hypothetical protein